jgi:hypothetical protein
MTNMFHCTDIVTHEEPVEQFVERLATLGLVDWLSVAASVTQTASSRADANAALDRVVAQHGLAYDAWSIADDVETAFQCGAGTTGRVPPPRDSLSLAIARQAAARAAVALFVRSLLTATDFELLYRPFASRHGVTSTTAASRDGRASSEATRAVTLGSASADLAPPARRRPGVGISGETAVPGIRATRPAATLGLSIFVRRLSAWR